VWREKKFPTKVQAEGMVKVVWDISGLSKNIGYPVPDSDPDPAGLDRESV